MQTMENSISPLCKICLVENNSITSLRNSLKTIKPNKYLSTKINEFKHYSFDTNVQINDT